MNLQSIASTMTTMTITTPNTNESTENNVRFRPKTKTVMVAVGGSIVVAASALTALGVLDIFSGVDQTNANDTETIDLTHSIRTIVTMPPTTSPVHQSSSPSVWQSSSPSESSSPSFAPSDSLAPSQTPSLSMTPTDAPSFSPTTSGQPSLTPSTAPSSYPTPVASSNPSMQPSISPSISLVPSKYPTSTPSSIPSVMPSGQPSMLPTTSFQPTKYPTIQPSMNPTTSASPTTKLSFDELTGQVTIPGTFHLRIYWKEGYLWQESPIETFWCMACATCNVNFFEKHCVIEDVCQENMMVATVECDAEKWNRDARKGLNPALPATFTLLKNEPIMGLFGAVSTGDRIQAFNTNLCLTRTEERDIYLLPCDSSVKEQLFFGFQPDGVEMELHPFTEKFLRGVPFEPERCLTQHHHPREGERIYSEFCRRARAAEHSKWVTY